MANTGVRESSVSFVYQRIKQDIIIGALAPGAPLRLQDLALRNGVSMSPIREALRLLEVEGLVVSSPNRGARVTPLSLEDLVDANHTRLCLEHEAIRRGFGRFRQDDIANARALNDQLRQRGELESDASRAIHRSFHLTVVTPSDSPRLLHFLEMLWDQTERYRNLPRESDALALCFTQHDRIIDAIAGGDLDDALAAVTTHLEFAMEQQRTSFLEAGYQAPTATGQFRKSGARRPVTPRRPPR